MQNLAIVDNIPGTNDTQTCNYLYDDLATARRQERQWLQRRLRHQCGSRTFTYDSFGNITKIGQLTFSPTYSPATNQFTISGANVQYDANGNLLTDNLNTYTWDPNWGNPASVNTTNLIYDALGRMVEQQNAAGIHGVPLQTDGQDGAHERTTLIKAFIALPGGAKAIYNRPVWHIIGTRIGWAARG